MNIYEGIYKSQLKMHLMCLNQTDLIKWDFKIVIQNISEAW